MRRRTVLVFVSVLALVAASVLTTAAAARPSRAAAPPLRTLAQAKSYLASLGIDARTVVIQRGARNYAGPRCPGKGWSCTRSTRVLQLGKSANRVECTGGTASVMTGVQSCSITQSGPDNTARCVERSTDDTVAQDCAVTQAGDRNTAVIDQAVESGGGSTQDATQTAEVMQNGGEGGNSLSVKQHVHQHVESGDAQTQDAHQELTSSQTATGSGDNVSSVKQDQNQDANNGTTQAQNTSASSSATTPCPAASLFFFGSDPNQCAFVAQQADAGDNANSFDQSLDEDAHSNSATDQTQGTFQGGMKAQAELVSASGASTDTARQRKSQTATGGASQTQIDPMGCCGLSASGNDESNETLDQSSTQNASEGADAFQELDVLGFVDTPTGGTCSVTQRASDNADSTSDSASSPSCETGVGLESSCTNASIGTELAGEQEPLGACESSPFVPEVPS